MRSAYARWLLVAALAAGSATAAGCANDQETINRVQANALKKSTLDGEWYYLQTVIDTPATTSFTFVGEQGSSLQKVRWDIEEDQLVARRSFEFIQGSEQQGADAINDAASTPLAVFAITSHFDIRREYNPATGEQTNVVSENSSDRHWSEREFMRVDWSKNLITDGNFMTLNKLFAGVETESIGNFVQEGEGAPVFEQDENGETYYVDIVTKLLVQPSQLDIPGFGKVPTCLLKETEQCDSGEIAVRNSFLKVTDRDYQPMDYTGDRMEKFGFFYSDRLAYSPDYGTVHSERKHFVNRHNIWKQSHRTTEENGKTVYLGCTAQKDCDDAKFPGSLCDKAWGEANESYAKSGAVLGRCTIPYVQREVKPIVYYATNLPEELAVDTNDYQKEWNNVFVEMVGSLRENECLQYGGKDCASWRGKDKSIFHVCASPVPAGAPEACGPKDLKPRPGDLRYSQIVWVSSEESAGPLGYGPGHSDPETGETIMGNAFVYGAAIERAAASGRDLLRMINGHLSIEDVQLGAYVADWAARASERGEDDATDRDLYEITPAQLAEDVAAMDYSWAQADNVQQEPRTLAELDAAFKQSFKGLHESGAYGRNVDEGTSRLSRLVGTDIEAMMITPEMRLAAGLNPLESNLGDEVLEAASPLRGRSLETLRALEHARQMIAEHAGFYDADFNDDGLVGIAEEIKAKAAKGGTIEWYGRKYEISKGGEVDYEAVRKMILHPLFHGLVLHEVGHSVGLRHNFSGSFDALNYGEEFWEMREDDDMAPRLWDAKLNSKEKKGRVREYQYSTVMDYGNNYVVSDAHGLGHYDRAAIKMGYADLVEVFEDVPDEAQVAGVAGIQALGWPVLFNPSNLKEIYAYTDWPKIVGGRANMYKRVDVPYSTLVPNPALSFAGPMLDAKGRVAVPYMFCTDNQRDLNPDCMLWDAGADAYESVKSIVDSYWYYYPLISFARQRVGFDVGPVVDRVHSRYFEKVKRAHQIYALYRPTFADIFGVKPDNTEFWTAKNAIGGWSGAADLGFRMLKNVITAPEPGGYGQRTQPDGSLALVPSTAQFNQFSVSPVDGRFLETTWNNDAGYYWGEQLQRVGYFYDKVLAIMTLVDPTTYFVGRDTDSDIRKWQISYMASFANPMQELFRGILSEDWGAIAPRLDENGRVIYPGISQLEKRSMAGTPLFPNVSFSIQLYAAVFGMGYIPQTYDQTFINSSRVWVQGGAEEIVFSPDVPLVTFTDPTSKLTYAAESFVDAEGVEHGVGASMLEYANSMLVTAAGPDEIFGNADDVPTARDAARKFIDNIDVVRRLTWQLGFGAQP